MNSGHTVRSAVAGALALAAVAAGCNEGPSGPPDRVVPEIMIVFPAGGTYDRDGDGLVDIEVAFTDTSSGIDPATLQIESSRPLGPNEQNGTDLLAGFRVVARDSIRVVLEETTDAVLPSGSIEIVARVSDREGNQAMALRAITLPAGALHKRLELPSFTTFDPVGIVMLPDGSQGFVPLFDGRVVPFDPWAVTLLPAVPRGAHTDLGSGTYDPTTGKVYFSNTAFPFVEVFDPLALAFEPSILVSARNIGVERGPSGLLYIALVMEEATVGVVDPGQRQEVRLIETGIPNELDPGETFITAPRVPPEEDRLYIPVLEARFEGLGVLVVDISTGQVRSVIDIHPRPDWLGFPQEAVLDANRRRLYVTDDSGLSEIDIDTDLMSRRISDPTLKTKFLSLSPSGRRLFVSAFPRFGSAQSWLVDVHSFAILERFTGVVPPAGENRSVFRPDGQLIFVNSGTAVAVYLNREP